MGNKEQLQPETRLRERVSLSYSACPKLAPLEKAVAGECMRISGTGITTILLVARTAARQVIGCAAECTHSDTAERLLQLQGLQHSSKISKRWSPQLASSLS